MIDLVYMSIVIQFSVLRYVIISCVYISNEFLNLHMLEAYEEEHEIDGSSHSHGGDMS